MRKKNKGSQSKSKYDKISIRNSENTENPCVAKQEENSGSKIISSPILSTTCSSTLVPSDILRPDSENASHDGKNGALYAKWNGPRIDEIPTEKGRTPTNTCAPLTMEKSQQNSIDGNLTDGNVTESRVSNPLITQVYWCGYCGLMHKDMDFVSDHVKKCH
ncbi:unnamed protein product [Hymenolepis diminuta]|uniref:Uncharacterized protein n=1 Tax=Hymenolepis diminuta TaxID=6216 RepID=A0A564YUF5_HYMDI|nr:unnamed protein product [Hymenolepis diminuta]